MTNEQLAAYELIFDAAISKGIEDKRELITPSMQHFIGGGKVNGEFHIAISKLLRWTENKTIEAAQSLLSSKDARISELERDMVYWKLEAHAKDEELRKAKVYIEALASLQNKPKKDNP